MYVYNEKGERVGAEKILTSEHYNSEQIQKMLKYNEKEKEYDYLIDKLYLKYEGKKNKRNKNRFEYSFLSARCLEKKEMSEIPIDDYLIKVLEAN